MKIAWYEPLFFLFFGAFHLHRVWGLADRESYAAFWLGVLTQKGPLYFGLMGLLAVLCLAGVATFFRNWGRNPWWRWIYLFGGSYVLFDLLAIAAGLSFWHSLLAWMFDVTSPAGIFSGAFSSCWAAPRPPWVSRFWCAAHIMGRFPTEPAHSLCSEFRTSRHPGCPATPARRTAARPPRPW
ncbi:MAG: hypothetical protein ACLRIS_00475 [Flavonifractor plautii]